MGGMNSKLSKLCSLFPGDQEADHSCPCSELFSSLLGQKVRVDEEDEDKGVDDVEMDGLRLFRN